MIYVVLGMHKSGTTLISQILHHSGINMMDEVDPAMGYDQGNKWERESTKEVNHRILHSGGAFSLQATRRGDLMLAAEQRARMREIIGDCSRKYGDWGFKDPRTCLTYPLWAQELPEHRVIVVYRLPEEGWAHYWKNAGKRRGTALREFMPRWCEYNGAILHALDRTKMKFIVLHYTRFMGAQEEFGRLESFVGRKLADKREAKMHRSRPEKFGLYPLARAIHLLRGGPRPENIAAKLESFRT